MSRVRLRVRLEELRGALPSAVANARSEWRERSLLLLFVEDGEGNVGVGEAAPLPGYSPDSLEDARAALAVWAPSLDLDGSLEQAVWEGLGSLPQLVIPAARAAVDVALIDIIARRRGLPAHRLLGAVAPAPVPLAGLLPMASLSSALAFVDAGDVAVFKAKIGRHLERELSLLEGLRRARPALSLRLDANGTLPTEPALHRRLAALAPEYVEEPLPLELLGERRLPYPVALDESLARGDDDALRRAFDAGLIAALVLKPGALGGLLRARELAALGAPYGVASSLSHLFDGPVARAAAAELALALERPAAAGLAAHPALSLFAPVDAPAFGAGCLRPHDAPGLGVDARSLRPAT